LITPLKSLGVPALFGNEFESFFGWFGKKGEILLTFLQITPKNRRLSRIIGYNHEFLEIAQNLLHFFWFSATI
jgi:hypothetical protein